MSEKELTISYEQTITLINRCVQQLYDLKEKVTEDYVNALKELKKEEYPEDANRAIADLEPVHPDNI